MEAHPTLVGGPGLAPRLPTYRTLLPAALPVRPSLTVQCPVPPVHPDIIHCDVGKRESALLILEGKIGIVLGIRLLTFKKSPFMNKKGKIIDLSFVHKEMVAM